MLAVSSDVKTVKPVGGWKSDAVHAYLCIDLAAAPGHAHLLTCSAAPPTCARPLSPLLSIAKLGDAPCCWNGVIGFGSGLHLSTGKRRRAKEGCQRCMEREELLTVAATRHTLSKAKVLQDRVRLRARQGRQVFGLLARAFINSIILAVS